MESQTSVKRRNKLNQITMLKTQLLTELYMSPLLFKALKKKKGMRDKYIEHNTHKSDVFSLGLCMFWAATLSMQSLVVK